MKKPTRRQPTVAELREIIPPIPDTPENVARRVFWRGHPKNHWRFLEKPAPKADRP